MPFFKSTYNILTKYDEDEVFNPNWMDSDKLVLPPNPAWDYKKEMTIEDVDIWEVIYEASNGVGLYAAWCPYAEFYLLTTGLDLREPRYIKEIPYWDRIIETYYGKDANKKIQQRIKELNLPIPMRDYWVDEENMWLYS
jgi:hypothetical protein